MKKVKLDAWELGFRKIEREHFNTTKHEFSHKKYRGMVVPLELWARCFAELERLARNELKVARQWLREGYRRETILRRMSAARKYQSLARELDVLKLGTYVKAN